MVSFAVDEHLLGDQGIAPDVRDLEYGLTHRWIGPATVVAIATREVAADGSDLALAKLVLVLRDELDEVPDVLRGRSARVDGSDRSSSRRKWLYLQLAAAFKRQQDLADPLGVVEQIHADFDYPRRWRGSLPTCLCGRAMSPATARFGAGGAIFWRPSTPRLRRVVAGPRQASVRARTGDSRRENRFWVQIQALQGAEMRRETVFAPRIV